MSRKELLNVFNANYNWGLFDLKESYFDRNSFVHGILHTYRVMCNCLRIGMLLDNERKTLLAFCAAFVHDMSRLDDGFCTDHGAVAARDKVPNFTELFESIGLTDEEVAEIAFAIEQHSRPFDLAENHPYFLTTAILMDADALDRFRLGDNCLQVDLLRLNESVDTIDFARELVHRTKSLKTVRLRDVLSIARGI